MVRVCVYLWLVLVCLSLWGQAIGRRTRYKPKPKPKPDKNPLEEITPVQNFDISQLSGKWYLLSVASRCKYLLEHGYKVEGTIMTLTAPVSPKAPVTVSTFTKLNYQCWEIKQKYETAQSPGRFLLRAKIPVKDTEILIVDTDYRSYAILLYKMGNKLTFKLYGRSSVIAENIVDKFEDMAKKLNLGLDVVFQFPTYGFCQSADEEHTLVPNKGHGGLLEPIPANIGNDLSRTVFGRDVRGYDLIHIKT